MTDMKTKLLALRALVDEAIADCATSSAVHPVAQAAYLTVDEYAQHRGVSAVTVYRWIKARMPHERVGSKLIRIDAKVADEWHRSGGVDAALKRDAESSARRTG